MNEPANHTIKTSKLANKFRFMPFIVFSASVGMTLIGIFVMSEWAELGGVNHATQHTLIFLGGAGAGASLMTTFKTKKDK